MADILDFYRTKMLLWKKKRSFTVKGNGMILSSEKISKDQDNTKQYEGCQGHAAQK
jgi:hypothetical protein